MRRRRRSYDDDYGFPRYVPVAQRRRKAERARRKLEKKGRPVSPVVIEGRTIARRFWGRAWCDNLERYSDYENRLPRGRAYVINGAVIDLQIEPGEARAMVSGSEIYEVEVSISAVPKARWKSICADCAGAIDSLVELLQGRFSRGVMERICRQKTGLFPSPAEIEFSCSCPDWAYMCKHVAAVLYGIGARFDERPELLFELRKVDEKKLIAKAGKDLPLSKKAPEAGKVLEDEDLFELFGLDMGAVEDQAAKIRETPVEPSKVRRKKKLPKKPVKKQKAARPAAPRGEKKAAHPSPKRTAKASKKRVVENYPKCAYPGCNKNRFPRGKGFCGEHWKMWVKGKISDAGHYIAKGKE